MSDDVGAGIPRTLIGLAHDMGIQAVTVRGWFYRHILDFPTVVIGGSHCVMPEHFAKARRCLKSLYNEGQPWRDGKKARVSST